MYIKFLDNNIVNILMKDYITESVDIFESLGEIIVACANNPATFFNKDEEGKSKLLRDDKSATFHHVVSTLLYISKRARVDVKL